jgi:hypothetical protein
VPKCGPSRENATRSDDRIETVTATEVLHPTSREARAPRYALDAFGRAYEVDEYGNSVARELVQLELALYWFAIGAEMWPE